MSQDFYELLQVHPRADQNAITAAYQRLRVAYDPTRLEGAADDLQQLARQKRDQIERAYSVLSDPQQRRSYDQALAARQAVAPALAETAPATRQVDDYRPLPPAGGVERARGFNTQPVRTVTEGMPGGRVVQQRNARVWVVPAVLGTLLGVVVTVALLVTGGGGPSTVAVPTAVPSLVDAYEDQIEAARAFAEQNPSTAEAWIDYGNVLYDSVQVVRELQPQSALYQQRLPRWLEASQAYSRALQLEPNNPIVRADLGVSQCYYGAGTGDQVIVRQGLVEAQQAAAAAPDDPRVLLSLGNCLVSVQPPQTQEAVAAWQRVIEIVPADSQQAIQARQLIDRYQ